MIMIDGVSPNMQRVFRYFEEISEVPRGSDNMKGIAEYCIRFAEEHSLRYVIDEANNIVIFKPATEGYENSDPIILQGHLDIVCQKDDDCDIDFLKDGLEIYVDGDFVKAKGTTLGADNGIAIAYVLAILESTDILHPAIEAVFTTDEEIGMIGALQLDTSLLNGRKMINLDAEEDDTLTVSCAGGSDLCLDIPISRIDVCETEVIVSLKGLRGGHSGVEINSGRVNANILAGRFLNHMKNNIDFDLISINGGDKSNAIPLACDMRFCVSRPEEFVEIANNYLEVIKNEISSREPDFLSQVVIKEKAEHRVIDKSLVEKLIYLLVCAPNGVVEMSVEIEGLVETSLNLGILKTEQHNIIVNFSLRSNKRSAMSFLEEKLKTFSKCVPCEVKSSGHYPPWEFKENSELQRLYKKCYYEQFGVEPKVEALHAGLECGVFASAIDGLDCIAIGPALFDVHTTSERLSISSAEQIYNLVLKILEECR